MIQIPLRNLFNFEVPFSVGYDKDGRVSIESLFKCHQGFSPISRQQAHRRHHLRPDSNQPNYATFLVWGLALILARSSWNRGERQFSFPSIPKNESLWFPFPSFGNGFFHSLPIPEFRECFFSFRSCSRSRTPECHSRSPLNGFDIEYDFERFLSKSHQGDHTCGCSVTLDCPGHDAVEALSNSYPWQHHHYLSNPSLQLEHSPKDMSSWAGVWHRPFQLPLVQWSWLQDRS